MNDRYIYPMLPFNREPGNFIPGFNFFSNRNPTHKTRKKFLLFPCVERVLFAQKIDYVTRFRLLTMRNPPRQCFTKYY